MGSFSWTCAACQRPVLGFSYAGYNKFLRAVALLPDGERVVGKYDGYGNLGATDLTDLPAFQLLHQSCYKDQSYDIAGTSGHDETQGSGYCEREMIEVFGEPDLSEIPAERTYACIQCLRTFQSKFSGGVCVYGCTPVICKTHGPQTQTQARAVLDTAVAEFYKRLGARQRELVANLGMAYGQAQARAYEELGGPECCEGCAKQLGDTVIALSPYDVLVRCDEADCFMRGRIHRAMDDLDFHHPLNQLAAAAADTVRYIRCSAGNHKARVLDLDVPCSSASATT